MAVAPTPGTTLLISFLSLPNNHSISMANKRSNCLAQASVNSLGLADVGWWLCSSWSLMQVRCASADLGWFQLDHLCSSWDQWASPVSFNDDGRRANINEQGQIRAVLERVACPPYRLILLVRASHVGELSTKGCILAPSVEATWKSHSKGHGYRQG